MSRPKWYTPQLSREIVRRLYYRAKAEDVAMTTLANRIMQEALNTEQAVECARDTDSDIAASGEHSVAAR
jgi:hypothetical protein